jgi:type II secretory ATPase GspE/PulE/Tfp pilus assembly ATPase PilB-like protein
VELLSITEEMRHLMMTGAALDEIRKQSIKDGMVLMRRDAMLKVKAGVTTPDEVMRRVSSMG